MRFFATLRMTNWMRLNYLKTMCIRAVSYTHLDVYKRQEYYYHVLTFDRLPLNLQEISLISSVYAEGKYQRYPEFKVDNILHGLIDLDFEWEVSK